ncbi:Hexapeptide repeat of succinyl-transferase [Tenacibaculum sp. 190524A05c]
MIKRLIKILYNKLKGINVDFKSDIPLNLDLNRISKEYPVTIINSTINNTTFGIGCKLSNCLCIGKIHLGNFVSIFGPGTVLNAKIGKIKIGNYCSIGQNVAIQESYHNYNNVTSYLLGKNVFKDNNIEDFVSKGDIVIEDDVWIGSNSIILSGVTIGRGAIIAAGSIVTKNINPYEIVGGNPAKKIRDRFSQEKIRELEDSKWWEWEIEKVIQNRSFFYQSEEL